jgi:hypothetical protein
VEYTGSGKATAAGLAATPDGLYFTDLYKDLNSTSAIDPGARLLRVRYVVGSPPAVTKSGSFDLKAAIRRCRKKHRGKARARCIRQAKKRSRVL